MDTTFKELKMSVLSLRIDGTIAVVESITRAISDAFANNADNTKKRISSTAIASLPPAQRYKVLEIRRRLAQDAYDIDRRLDVILERILADIT